MGLFKYLAELNNKFFEGLKRNAIDNAIKANNSRNIKNSTKIQSKNSSGVVNKLSEINKLARELEADLEYYELSPEEEKILENLQKEKLKKLIESIYSGMTLSELNKLGIEFNKKTTNLIRGKEVIKLYYGEKENRLGNQSFEFEITLKEGKIFGWKDLRNIGTRSI